MRDYSSQKIYHITDEEWSYLSTICDILETFKTDEFQFHAIIYQFAVETEDYTAENWFKSNLLALFGIEEFQRKFLFYYPIRDYDINSIRNLCFATVLDPRLKL